MESRRQAVSDGSSGAISRLSRHRRRAQLLRCALAAFAQNGLGRTGHAQVAEIAGVSVPTVFKYFPSRQALVDAVLSRVERSFLTLARRSHQTGRPPREAMHEHARGFLMIARNEPDLARIWVEWSGSLRDDVWPRFLKLEEKLTRIIARGIDRCTETPDNLTAVEAALALNGVAHVLIHMIIAPKGLPGDPEAFALHVIDALLRLTSTAQERANSTKSDAVRRSANVHSLSLSQGRVNDVSSPQRSNNSAFVGVDGRKRRTNGRAIRE
jgi:TetR/AcrR family transcriptional regulator, hemagglutinin/protease regulatory protein